jgi:hypothetical protein
MHVDYACRIAERTGVLRRPGASTPYEKPLNMPHLLIHLQHQESVEAEIKRWRLSYVHIIEFKGAKSDG